MAISQERATQLLQLYEQLKADLENVDKKYSLTALIVDIDLPESLQLEHLTFTPLTNQQVEDQAEQNTLASYNGKLQSLTDKYNQNVLDNTNSASKLTQSHTAKLATLLDNFNLCSDKLIKKLIDNGLMFSNLITSEVEKERAKYTQQVTNQTNEYNAQLTLITNKRTQLDSIYQQDCEQLESQHLLDVDCEKQKILNAQEKTRLAVIKYNQSLDEKETKYQASRAKSLVYANQQEHQRALEASRLYAELGESGINNQKCSEKLVLCKSTFGTLNAEEASAMLSIDSAVRNHLGTYYSYLTDWVSTYCN